MDKELIALVKRLKDLEHYIDLAEETDWNHVTGELEFIEEHYPDLAYHVAVGYTPEYFEKKILEMKRELGLYVEEDMLDMMFPDRQDEDFDEDSMSWDSVFGGD